MLDSEPDKDSATGGKRAERNSCPPRLEPCGGRFRKVFHAFNFGLELPPPGRCEPVALLVSGCVVQFGGFDPTVFEKPADRSEQCSRAHPDTSTAQSLNVLEQGIPVPRPIGQT